MKVLYNSVNDVKLLEVLHDGLSKETNHLPNLECLARNKDPEAITLCSRDSSVVFLLHLNRHCGFQAETFTLAVNLLDRFLSLVKANRKYLPCISICCLFLAVKVTEEDEDVPTAAELIRASGLGFSPSDLLRMERIILDKLQWNLNAATPLHFFQLFHALLVSKGFFHHCPVNKLLHSTTFALQELLCCHKFVFFKPSTLALALLNCELASVGSNRILAVHHLQEETKIPETELRYCSQLVLGHLQFHLTGRNCVRALTDRMTCCQSTSSDV